MREPRAYLVRITTRLALNRIRTLSRRRESYVGPWLPEPLLTSPDVAEDVELADSVSTAMLLVLETLTPTERAVFVLREVFDLPYDEIAAAVDKSAPAVRQIAHRARNHVEARRPRQQVTRGRADRGGRAVPRRGRDRGPPGAARRAVAGRRPDHRRRRQEAGRAASDPRRREGAAVPRRGDARRRVRLGCAGRRSTAARACGSCSATSSTPIATMRVDDGLVTELYLVRNPDKLGRVDAEVALSR